MGRNAGTSIVSFLVGATFGAVIALLYAPSSGEELRGQIRG
ncbi:MAG: YtxH domain-containing protein, partial [Gammaproteobacteria bacterium]|nr:YtxH domain-containing protein [Gammaproteobacteria bacterium]